MRSFVPLSFPKRYEQVLDDTELRKRIDEIFEKLELEHDLDALSKLLIPLIKKIFPLISQKEAEIEVQYILWLVIIDLSKTYDDWEKKPEDIGKVVYTAAKNICYNQLERNKVHYKREPQIDFSSPTVFHRQPDSTINLDTQEALQEFSTQLKKRLTQRQHEVFHYRVIHDWSHKEIAEHLNISYSSSTTIFGDVKKIIRNEFGAELNDLFQWHERKKGS